MLKFLTKIMAMLVIILLVKTIFFKEPQYIWVVKVVEPYDSVWNLVSEEQGNKTENIAMLVEKVREENHLDSLNIQPGQKILIPVKQN